MKQSFFLGITTLLLTSCFLQKPYRMETFSFTEKGVSYSYPIVVPRGYKKKFSSVDEAGNNIITYSYKNGAVFYFTHMADTSVDMQPFNDHENIARQSHHTGALIYKGMDANYLYWREVRQNNLRAGYRFVIGDEEVRFDSATNYLVVWPMKNTNAR
jgi:hypothetical protein